VHRAIALCLLLGGCASLDKAECLNADWYAIGLEDGARGRALERLGEHRRACAGHGVAPNSERYLAGRAEGLKSFCTFQRGHSNGRAGQAFADVCPAELAGAFTAGYRQGRELYELNRQLSSVQSEIRKSKGALKEGIADPRARAREVERLEDLSREAENLERELSRLQGH
jgi:hypothetical protein